MKTTFSTDNRYLFPMIVMSILFFMVGFITTLNNSLIDFLAGSKWMLSLSEKQLINTAFFGAYLFSVPLSFLLDRLGYKASAVLSLFVIFVGFILVILTVRLGYFAFLASMLLVALGVALLQIVLNPYVLALGKPEEAASRLTLVGFFNSLATVTAPLFVAFILTSPALPADAPAEMRPAPESVRGPFMIIAGLAFLLCLILFFLKLPEIRTEGVKTDSIASLFKCPHLVFGALAIFFYMGIEVGIPSFLPDRMRGLGMDSLEIFGTDLNVGNILALYWGGMMVGRLIGAVVLRKVNVRYAMIACSIAAIMLIGGSMAVDSPVAIVFMVIAGLCNSIMWGGIFNLASADLGDSAKLASGIICTFAIGGAVLPPLMGALQQSFGVAAITTGTIAALACLIIFYLYIILFSSRLCIIRKNKHK